MKTNYAVLWSLSKKNNKSAKELRILPQARNYNPNELNKSYTKRFECIIFGVTFQKKILFQFETKFCNRNNYIVMMPLGATFYLFRSKIEYSWSW